VHAMRAIYDNPSIEAVLLVDASNAFNNLKCQVALWNMQTLFPSLATVLINTYRPYLLIITASIPLKELHKETHRLWLCILSALL